MDDMDRTVEAVCRLVVDFRVLGNVSAVDLVVMSGYQSAADRITVDRVTECLNAHPDWVEAWLMWSQDQRSSPAWWVAARSTSGYEVGYHDPRLKRQRPPFVFDDKVRACGEFVVRAAQSIEDGRQRVEAGRKPGESYIDAAIRLSASRLD